MNLRGIANQVSNIVNPNIIVTWAASAGYSVGAGRKQTPIYAAGVTGPGQLQALDNSDLKHLENMNIQGVIKALYMYGNLAGVIRPDSKGGDLITIGADSGAPPAFQGTWLTVKVIEGWAQWTKVVIVKQGGV